VAASAEAALASARANDRAEIGALQATVRQLREQLETRHTT